MTNQNRSSRKHSWRATGAALSWCVCVVCCHRNSRYLVCVMSLTSSRATCSVFSLTRLKYVRVHASYTRWAFMRFNWVRCISSSTSYQQGVPARCLSAISTARRMIKTRASAHRHASGRRQTKAPVRPQSSCPATLMQSFRSATRCVRTS